MRNLFMISIWLLGINTVFGQSIDMETGQTASNITYTDDSGNKVDNILPNTYSYLKLGYSGTIFSDRLHLGGRLGYMRYGATASDDILNNYYQWDLTYLGIGVSLDFDFFKPGKFTFSLIGEASIEFLIQGTQTINNQVFKLVGEEDFDIPIYMFRGGLSIDYQITNRLSAFTSYTYGGGGPFKKDAQKFNFKVQNLGIGIRINISAKDEPMPQQSAEYLRMSEELVYTRQKIDTLEEKAQRVDMLEQNLSLKEKEMTLLKDTLSSILFDYGDKDLEVELTGGRIHITLENDMLFQSGSYTLQEEGRQAINSIARILEDNKEMNILIEGHTDNQTYKSNGDVQNNWDLSTKRACAIVNVLQENENINPRNITVAGRAEFAPIESNSTPEGRASNRRIEVIIFPPLDKLSVLLNN